MKIAYFHVWLCYASTVSQRHKMLHLSHEHLSHVNLFPLWTEILWRDSGSMQMIVLSCTGWMAIVAIFANPNHVKNLNKRNGVWRRSTVLIQGWLWGQHLRLAWRGWSSSHPQKQKWKKFWHRFRKENDWWNRKNLKKIFPCENPSWKYHLHWSRVPFKIWQNHFAYQSASWPKRNIPGTCEN